MIRIVPAVVKLDGARSFAHSTQGTRVFNGDTEIVGVTRIEIVGEVDGVWQVKLHCLGTLDSDMTVLTSQAREYRLPPTLRQALSAWWAGVRETTQRKWKAARDA